MPHGTGTSQQLFIFSRCSDFVARALSHAVTIRTPQILHVCALVHDVLTLRTGAFDLSVYYSQSLLSVGVR